MLIDTFTREQMKILGVNALSRLGVCVPYILDYAENSRIYLFDCDHDWEGRRIAICSELAAKIAELRRVYGVQIYAVTHEKLWFGEVYTFLCISKYVEDFDRMVMPHGTSLYRAYAYAWNRSTEECSEFGSVILEPYNGKLRRVG